MSRRTAESNKAILAAWNKEQELVQEGKGTREWTPQQQQDILEKGKAYDDNGKAFEGQHMKSAEMYPEYQGEPGNIQFLTRAEHLEAHDGNWQNPTNWYYSPVTKEKFDFGDEPFIPCEIIELEEPIAIIPKNDIKFQECDIYEESFEKQTDLQVPNTNIDNQIHKKSETSTTTNVQVSKETNNMFVRGLKSTGRFIVEHPIESLGIVGVVIGGATKIVSSIRRGTAGGSHGTTLLTSSSLTSATSISDEIADIVKKANRVLPRENDVASHKQHYHTKNGVILKEKAPYHRGGNKN